jgi:uncharacterized membrane protein
VEGGTLAAVTAASELGGKVTGLVIGAPGEVERVVEKVKKSVHRLFLSSSMLTCDLALFASIG